MISNFLRSWSPPQVTNWFVLGDEFWFDFFFLIIFIDSQILIFSNTNFTFITPWKWVSNSDLSQFQSHCSFITSSLLIETKTYNSDSLPLHITELKKILSKMEPIFSMLVCAETININQGVFVTGKINWKLI